MKYTVKAKGKKLTFAELAAFVDRMRSLGDIPDRAVVTSTFKGFELNDDKLEPALAATPADPWLDPASTDSGDPR